MRLNDLETPFSPLYRANLSPNPPFYPSFRFSLLLRANYRLAYVRKTISIELEGVRVRKGSVSRGDADCNGVLATAAFPVPIFAAEAGADGCGRTVDRFRRGVSSSRYRSSQRTFLTNLRYLDFPSMLPILFAAPSREYYLSGRSRNRMPVEWHLTVL